MIVALDPPRILVPVFFLPQAEMEVYKISSGEHKTTDLALIKVKTEIDLTVYTPLCMPSAGKGPFMNYDIKMGGGRSWETWGGVTKVAKIVFSFS